MGKMCLRKGRKLFEKEGTEWSGVKLSLGRNRIEGDGERGEEKKKKKNSIEIRWFHFPEINKFNNILVNRVTLSSTGFCFLKKD